MYFILLFRCFCFHNAVGPLDRWSLSLLSILHFCEDFASLRWANERRKRAIQWKCRRTGNGLRQVMKTIPNNQKRKVVVDRGVHS